MTESEELLNVKKHIHGHIRAWGKNSIFRDSTVNAIDTAIKALEKQIPKTVYHFVDDDTFETSCCGIDVSNEDFKYCPECGQLLGEVEEVREEN